MKITISKKVDKKFKDQRALKAYFGKLADRIEMVISILRFVDNLGEVPNVPPTRRHKLIGNYDGCWALDIDKSRRMIIKPIVESNILEEIDELEIVDVVDYH